MSELNTSSKKGITSYLSNNTEHTQKVFLMIGCIMKEYPLALNGVTGQSLLNSLYIESADLLISYDEGSFDPNKIKVCRETLQHVDSYFSENIGNFVNEDDLNMAAHNLMLLGSVLCPDVSVKTFDFSGDHKRFFRYNCILDRVHIVFEETILHLIKDKMPKNVSEAFDAYFLYLQKS